jgi:hypothetical protein
MAIDASVMPRVRRSLVIAREDVQDFRSSPSFRVEVDGRYLPSTSRRALFELRYNGLTAHVIVIGQRAIALQACQWEDLIDPTFDAEKTTKAILACDRRLPEAHDSHSLVPLVQASMHVLELGPERLGAFKAPRNYVPGAARHAGFKSLHKGFLPTFYYLHGQSPLIQQLSCDAGFQSDYEPLCRAAMTLAPSAWHVAMFFLLPVVLGDLAPWPFAFVSGAVCFLPTLLLLRLAALWLYVRPLDARAAEMIARTPP